ncbi:MAG: enolase [bacterium]|nr:enolase [bacterium]
MDNLKIKKISARPRSKISLLRGREILDSKGMPTVEVELETDFGKFLASVPSGVSTGKYEAVELRDEDGRGVKKVIENIEKIIAPSLKQEDLSDQKRVDEALIQLDGTKNKSRLGANAVLGVSIATARAGAKAKKFPLWKWISKIAGIKPALPRPCILLLEGGLHGKGKLSLQEIMVACKTKSFRESFDREKKVFSALGKILKKRYGQLGSKQGMEGAFIPPVKNAKEALSLAKEAIEKVGFLGKAEIIIDAAANSFFKKGKYHFDGSILNSKDLLSFYLEIFQQYPITAIEDPFAEEDVKGWKFLRSKVKNLKLKILVVGDDLTVTNPERIKFAHQRKICNALIIKPNQIGTISEAIAAAKLAKLYGWKIIVSHRSGETKDDFIADFAVGIGSNFIKAGAPTQKERMAKYNRLLAIEKELVDSLGK